MRYYLVKVTNKDNEILEHRAYTTKKEANVFVKIKHWNRCDKHYHHQEFGDCSCRLYSIYLVNEKLIDKKENGNV